ncbi:MAG TPA: hypothetical protein ACFYEJ_04350 [Candidatus Wujingus californicus]|uniref:hypothetical protein n=1 Tax=Candidatus Wujingus californicus TaxID=3367618 RepID=UPI001D24D5F0|nr:hypothetical protein [Planctomycetota bacterium]
MRFLTNGGLLLGLEMSCCRLRVMNRQPEPTYGIECMMVSIVFLLRTNKNNKEKPP